jgi:hypothetical protein
MTNDERALEGCRIAVLVADGFEQIELTEPIEALLNAGAETMIVSPAGEKVRAWNQMRWGMRFTVECPLEEARADDFDAVLLPGGERGEEELRKHPAAEKLCQELEAAGKPVCRRQENEPLTKFVDGLIDGLRDRLSGTTRRRSTERHARRDRDHSRYAL